MSPRLSRRTNPVRDDRGAATLIAAALVGVLIAVTAGVAVLGAAVIARHRAQAAADLAAHAAATGLPAGQRFACAQAASVAAAMGTALAGCVVEGLDAVVTIDAETGVRRWRARAQARAGPADQSAASSALPSLSIDFRLARVLTSPGSWATTAPC